MQPENQAIDRAKVKNKFVSPYPTDPVKIGRLKFFFGKFAVTFFFLSLVSLKICFAENSVFYIRFAKRSIFSHYRTHLCRQCVWNERAIKESSYIKGCQCMPNRLNESVQITLRIILGTTYQLLWLVGIKKEGFFIYILLYTKCLYHDAKKKAYLPTHFQNCGSGKGKQKYF